MTYDPLLISLPVADRVRAHAFYREGLGLDAISEPANDGVPEPLTWTSQRNSIAAMWLVVRVAHAIGFPPSKTSVRRMFCSWVPSGDR